VWTLSGYDEPHLRRCSVVPLWNVSSLLSNSDPDAFLRGCRHYHMESRFASQDSAYSTRNKAVARSPGEGLLAGTMPFCLL
jgi:hypothetical protein